MARVVQALKQAGAPLDEARQHALDAAAADPAKAAQSVQEALDPLCLAAVTINPESRVKVAAGPAAKKLVQNGWRVFLVKIHNEAGVTAPIQKSSSRKPTRRSVAAAASRCSSFRLAITTCAPREPSNSAIPKPIPVAPPVMSAT